MQKNKNESLCLINAFRCRTSNRKPSFEIIKQLDHFKRSTENHFKSGTNSWDSAGSRSSGPKAAAKLSSLMLNTTKQAGGNVEKREHLSVSLRDGQEKQTLGSFRSSLCPNKAVCLYAVYCRWFREQNQEKTE